MAAEKEIIKGKTLEEKMQIAEEQGRNYFRQGLNCTECLMHTMMDLYETGLPDEAIRLATGFGGGIGNTKHICGAITGAVMALGVIRGRENPTGPREEMKERTKHLQQDIYPVFAKMREELEKEYGTLICSEMTRVFEDFHSKQRMRTCMDIVGFCAKTAVKYAELGLDA